MPQNMSQVFSRSGQNAANRQKPMTRVWLIPWVIMLIFSIIISLLAGFLIGDWKEGWGKVNPPVDVAPLTATNKPNPPTEDKSTDSPPTPKLANNISTETPPENVQADSPPPQKLPDISTNWKQITQYVQQSEVIRTETLNTVLQKIPELAPLPYSQFATQAMPATVSSPISWKILSLQLETVETQQREVLNRFLEKIDK